MLKGIQVKLYPSTEQLTLIKQHADASRWVYNECIARGKDNYEKSGQSLSKYSLIKSITQLLSILEYKLAERKSMLVKVNPMFTSQTCSVCGRVDKSSRCGEQFYCTSYSHTEDADTNAVKNIKSMGIDK